LAGPKYWPWSAFGGKFAKKKMDSAQDTDWVETAEVVLAKRWCRTSVGMARLFCELAIAAGLEETRMIYGYLRGTIEQSNCS
jgi:hypothetical protein